MPTIARIVAGSMLLWVAMTHHAIAQTPDLVYVLQPEGMSTAALAGTGAE